VQFLFTAKSVPHPTVNKQQTPKPAAQCPPFEPPAVTHSLLVMQVPDMLLSTAVVQVFC
jgi:hypothetical protein